MATHGSTILMKPFSALFHQLRGIVAPIKAAVAFSPCYAIRLRYRRTRSLDGLLRKVASEYQGMRPWTALDLGCGPSPANPFHAEVPSGIDIRESQLRNVFTADLAIEGIPFGDCAFDFVSANDFVEHVPRVLVNGKTRFPFVQLMSEVHRVLKRGGIFYSRTPAYPYKVAFQDPTHVNVITEDTFPLYFCYNQCGDPLARTYGFATPFRLIAQEWHGYHLVTLMEKVD